MFLDILRHDSPLKGTEIATCSLDFTKKHVEAILDDKKSRKEAYD
jgi:hypothetical protein